MVYDNTAKPWWYWSRIYLLRLNHNQIPWSWNLSRACAQQTAFFRPGCLLTRMVLGVENFVKVAQASPESALAAAVARMCMIVSRVDSLKNKEHRGV